MAKTDAIVSMAGSFQTTATLLDAATRERGGSLSEALVLLGTAQYKNDLDSVADIIARVSQKHKAVAEAAERVKVVNKTTIMVNLASAPVLPFDNAAIEHNAGGGWVKVEKKKDGLYVNGEKVVLRLAPAQKTGTIRGHELRTELGNNVLHPNILDALYDHAHLIPDDFKQDEQGRTRYIFFWGVIFRDSYGHLFVRFLAWPGGTWGRYYSWLGLDFGVGFPAASLAS